MLMTTNWLTIKRFERKTENVTVKEKKSSIIRSMVNCWRLFATGMNEWRMNKCKYESDYGT
jgi:hypothetical protein